MKYIKKIVLFVLLLIPFNAFALTYDWGDVRDGGTKGTTIVYIKIANATEEDFKTDKLTCTSSNVDVTCILEPAGVDYVITDSIVSKADNTALTDGNIARIVLTNSKTEDAKTDVSLIYSSKNEDGIDNVNSIVKNNVEISGKEPPQSTDSSIHTLTYSPESATIFPEFKPDVYNYTIYGIKDTVSRVKFTYNCDKCSVKFEGDRTENSFVYFLTGVNETEAKAIVTSQDQNSTTTYYFKLIRGSSTFNSDKIKSIKLEDYEITPEVKGDVKEYQVIVPKKITNIENTLKVETEDSGAKVKIEGANKLDSDENTVKITVTAQDEKTNEYTLKVIREDNEEEIIEVIYYKNKVVAFMNVENVREELSEDKFKEKYPNEWAKIEDKTYKFDEEGNILKNQEETPVEEPVIQEEDKKEENDFPWLIIILILGAIVIIIVAGIIIFKEPKKKDEDEEVATEEEKENLDDIDTYNEEARLIAQNNIEEAETKVDEPAAEEATEVPEELNDTVQNNVVEPEETVVSEQEIGDYEEDQSPTMDIDEALSDLMNTKEYDFKDK